MTQTIVTCAWEAVDAESLNLAEYVDWMSTPETLAIITQELATSLFIQPADVASQITEGNVMFLIDEAIPDMIAAVFVGSDTTYFRRKCSESPAGPAAASSKVVTAVVGGGAGGAVGYFVGSAMFANPILGAVVGAGAGLLSAFALTGAKKTSAVSGLGRVPRRVMYQSRGPIGWIPPRMQYAPRGPIGRCVGCW